VTEFLVFLSVLVSLPKNPPKLSLNRNSSPNGLGHSLTLKVNSSLCVIGVGFQLYGQLKKSPHDITGVLGSFAISTVSQTTRLGKGSSVTMMGDQREFDLKTRVTANGDNKTPRCFTVVH